VARNHGVALDEDAAKRAVSPILSLPPHADVVPAIERLREARYRLVTLTNSSNAAIAKQMKNSGLQKFFENELSVEDIGLYKPHAHVSRWAARDVSECLLVAAHGWDVAGAKWAGMRTALDRASRSFLSPRHQTSQSRLSRSWGISWRSCNSPPFDQFRPGSGHSGADTLKKIRDLLRAGHRIADVAREVGVSGSTVHRVRREMAAAVRRDAAGQAATLQSITLAIQAPAAGSNRTR
jgi:hypothetical protein